jgi:hypothetical protein
MLPRLLDRCANKAKNERVVDQERYKAKGERYSARDIPQQGSDTWRLAFFFCTATIRIITFIEIIMYRIKETRELESHKEYIYLDRI